MARPTKEGLSYFPHDCDASNDEKIEGLRALHGNDGYAFYFILLERIYRAPNAVLDMSTPTTEKILSTKVGVSLKRFQRILASALESGLFDKELFENSKSLSSNGIQRRANVVLQHRANMRQGYAQKKGISSAEIIEEIEEEIPPENISEMTQSKLNKTKINKNKINNSKLNTSIGTNLVNTLEGVNSRECNVVRGNPTLAVNSDSPIPPIAATPPSPEEPREVKWWLASGDHGREEPPDLSF